MGTYSEFAIPSAVLLIYHPRDRVYTLVLETQTLSPSLSARNQRIPSVEEGTLKETGLDG